MELPLGLVTALESGRCVLFIGAGIGYSAILADGSPVPDGTALAMDLASRFGIDLGGDTPDLAKVSQLVELRKGRKDLIAALKSVLDGAVPTEDLEWLCSLTWAAIFTTNYDNLIEAAHAKNPDPTQRPVVIATNSEAKSIDARLDLPIIHLHGSLQTDGGAGAVLITERDYATFREKRSMLFERYKFDYATSPILYIGYSHNDPNWRMITAEVNAQFVGGRVQSQSFRIAPTTPPMDREILEATGLHTLDGNLSEFRHAVSTSIGELRVDLTTFDDLRATVPSDLQGVFESHKAPLLRLLDRWTYVNQADFRAEPNFPEFLKGHPPNWSLVGTGVNFQRDLEHPLVEDILAFATEERPGLRLRLALGPAGYGMTTLLMAVAAWAARNRAAHVLFHKPGRPLEPSDLEFAARNLGGPVIFVVDDASDFGPALQTSSHQLKEAGLDAYLLFGDRLNEWRQARLRITAREFALEPLSDNEIDALLAMLSQRNALGAMADLTPELQFSNIKVRNQQELLVTMRELTEGVAFDAIVEDEYRSIGDDFGRRAYAIVCSFSRSRALIRDSLLAEVLGCNVADLYGPMMIGTEGLLLLVDLNGPSGGSAFRARHQIIADIVWRRSVELVTRQRGMMNAIDKLNISYTLDAKAFEAFTRSDDVVDSLQSLESKMEFFESACRKDPTNAYVRQHYARMLRREHAYEQALAQVEAALALAPRGRVLWHTKGTILRDLAVDPRTSIDVGRARAAQSESAFRSALNLNDRDEYSMQGLADLYLDWAKRVAPHDPAESIDYVRRSEETVREGLAKVRQKEGMYIVSSRIEEFLGDLPGGIDELRKATGLAPDSVIAAYLLGMALRRADDLEAADAVLSRSLERNPDDPRLARALAVTKVELTGDYSVGISILTLAALRGSDDAMFVATYGGMLVMNRDATRAEEVWRSAAKLRWAVEQQNRIGYRPPSSETGEQKLTGSVVKVGPGFAFIASAGLLDFFLAGSRFGDIDIREGIDVSFSPGFSVRGPVALNVERPV